MATYYIDLVSGNDSTGTGSNVAPYKTLNKAETIAATGDIFRIAKTGAHTTVTPAASITFTEGSVTATASADITASLAAGDWIGVGTIIGNGGYNTFYRINTITFSVGVTTITLANKFIPATTTVSSVTKCTYATDTGNSSVFTTFTMAPNNKNLTISGGWDLSTQLQTGETWFKGSPASRGTSWGIFKPYGTSNLTISKINVVETYQLANTWVQNTFNNCSIHTYNCPALTNTISAAMSASYYNMAISCETGSYIYLMTGGGTFTITNLQMNAPTSQHYYSQAASTMNFNGCICVGASYAVYGVAAGTKFILNDMLLKYNSYGVGFTQGNVFIDCTGATIRNHNTGIYITGQYMFDYWIKNGTFLNNSYDIYFNDSSACLVEGINSTNSTYSVFSPNQYGKDILVTGCSFTTPTNYACYQNGLMTNYKIVNCTIDAPSAAKLFPLNTTSLFSQPQFIIDNCSNVNSGLYYGYMSLTKSTVTYRTQSPAIQIQAKTTLTSVTLPLKLWSTWGAASTGYTLGFWINANNTWTGTLDIYIRVGGKDVLSQTTSSLANAWTQYTFNITAGMMTQDAEISVHVRMNDNAVATFYDDFTIV